MCGLKKAVTLQEAKANKAFHFISAGDLLVLMEETYRPQRPLVTAGTLILLALEKHRQENHALKASLALPPS
jgi:hypothetical protein